MRIVAVVIVTLPAVIVQVGTAVNTWVMVNGVRLRTVQAVSAVLKPDPEIDTVPPSLTAPGLTVSVGENGLTVNAALAVSPLEPFTVTTYCPLVAVVAIVKLVAVN